MPLLGVCHLSAPENGRFVAAACWTIVFFLAVAIRVCLPQSVGETLCVASLVVGTTAAFTCWDGPGPGRFNDDGGNNDSDNDNNNARHQDHRVDDEDHHHYLEAVELQQSNSSQDHLGIEASLSIERDVTAGTGLNEEDQNNNPIDGNNNKTAATTTNCSDTTIHNNHNNSNNGRTPSTTTTTTTTATTIVSRRMPFLDNLKTFLTSLVVTHHAACAFGGCGEGSWYLVVGEGGSPTFRRFVRSLALLDQSFFMPLFFFISACFVPSSYAHAGGWRKFRASKRRRVLIPALFVFFVVSPGAVLISGKRVYFPNPGPAWFLYWLLLFNLVYASFPAPIGGPPGSAISEESRDRSASTTPLIERHEEGLAAIEPLLQGEGADTAPDADEAVVVAAAPVSKLILSTGFRVACGIGICGLSLMPFLALELGSFASMPLTIGSLTCDFFMFYLGLQAKKHGWFDEPLVEHLDIHPMILACFVAFEGTALVAMESDTEKWGLLLVIVAGMFCLDMGLFLLVVFQRWADFETSTTRFLAKGAYGVYLLHPVVVTGATRLYLNVGGINEGRDGAHFCPLGFIFVAVASQVINWPLSYFLAQLPGLKTIL